MDFSNFTAANCTTTSSALSLDDMRKLSDEMDQKRHELLRGESLMIESMECPTCHRKPTVINGPWGKTYVVCPHTWEAIKKHVPRADPPAYTSSGLPPLGWSPYGVHIEVMDDGPRRW